MTDLCMGLGTAMLARSPTRQGQARKILDRPWTARLRRGCGQIPVLAKSVLCKYS